MLKRIIATASLVFATIALTVVSVYGKTDKGSHEIDPQIKKEVLKVLDDYLASFNAKDLHAHYATYHFPHYRLASGKMTILEKPDYADSTKFFAKLIQEGWHHSVWEHRNIVQASDSKVHIDTKFIRYRADGTVLGTFESLYIVTKEEGKWGIKMRSSYAN